MYFYTAPSESFPTSYETKQVLNDLADTITNIQSAISARPIRVMANSDIICSGDIEMLYRKEIRLSQSNPLAAELIYEARLNLAQSFSNDFYKNPETGFNAPNEDEDA